MRKSFVALLGATSLAVVGGTAATAQVDGWCAGQDIIVFSGGPAGGTFNSIIDKARFRPPPIPARMSSCSTLTGTLS